MLACSANQDGDTIILRMDTVAMGCANLNYNNCTHTHIYIYCICTCVHTSVHIFTNFFTYMIFAFWTDIMQNGIGYLMKCQWQTWMGHPIHQNPMGYLGGAWIYALDCWQVVKHRLFNALLSEIDGNSGFHLRAGSTMNDRANMTSIIWNSTFDLTKTL